MAETDTLFNLASRADDLAYEARALHGTLAALCGCVDIGDDPVVNHVHAALGRITGDMEGLARDIYAESRRRRGDASE